MTALLWSLSIWSLVAVAWALIWGLSLIHI